MSVAVESKPWDLSHVLDLAKSLSIEPTHFLPGRNERGSCPDNAQAHEQNGHTASVKIDPTEALPSLGDFGNIWKYLGIPPKAPASTPTHSAAPGEAEGLSRKDGYNSEGAVYSKTSSIVDKKLRWDNHTSTEEQISDGSSGSSVVPSNPGLTKSQRKKRNRREKKRRETALAVKHVAKSAAVSESEADNILRITPARKASAHSITKSSTEPNERPQLPTSTSNDAFKDTTDPLLEVGLQCIAESKLAAGKKADLEAFIAQMDVLSSKPLAADRSSSQVRQHSRTAPSLTDNISTHYTIHSHPTYIQQWPVTTPPNNSKRHLVSFINQPSHYSTTQPGSFQHGVGKTYQTKLPPIIAPKMVRSGDERNWTLLMKLIGNFVQDRKHLISPMNLTTHNNDPHGIHVFVDASNIFIGFNDQIKQSCGIPQSAYTPPIGLSFDALALLMERRRPVAKRVLVGSKPHLSAFDKAKAVGYECNILEKVYKARELTERQIYFKEVDRGQSRNRAKAPPASRLPSTTSTAHAVLNGVASSVAGSGSETNTPQYAPARMIEQGVDEILHLKILESIVDSDKPNTMVLATGDAAQAEYSQGFMAMVERALKKGWTVELVSWSKNISSMYTRREWSDAWDGRFKIILLDDYADELLDV